MLRLCGYPDGSNERRSTAHVTRLDFSGKMAGDGDSDHVTLAQMGDRDGAQFVPFFSVVCKWATAVARSNNSSASRIILIRSVFI